MFMYNTFENKEKQSVVSLYFMQESEVIHMLETALITNIALSIISFVLVIVLAIITYKENRISASR